jgi:hypothetical protein
LILLKVAHRALPIFCKIAVGRRKEFEMQKLRTLIAVTAISLALAPSVFAQPRPYGQPGPNHGQYQQRGHPAPGPAQSDRSGGQYYYNGRWVDQGEWQRHSSERDRWAQNYQRRRGNHGGDNTSALLGGIIGFALGAAIVGSQQQAERARTADQSYDAVCARKYRTYDRNSRTYMGFDGARHYCQ